MASAGRIRAKVCIVTGASSGIGLGIAELFAREGGSVIIADIQTQKGEETARAVAAAGGVASFCQLDVTDEKSWQETIEHVLKKYGKLDVLVNNAGIGFVKPILATTVAEWRKVMAVNVEGVFLGVKAAVPAMMKNGRRGGAIINISSNIVYVPSATQGAYCTSKGAVGSFSKVAAIEFAPDNIRVNTVYPGFVETPILDAAFREAEKAGRSRDELMQVFAGSNLVGRVGQPVDLAYPVLFLASDESRFVTGSDFVIDGGEVWKRGGAADAAAIDSSSKT
jgi:NAD(P)-dependent dehydrogenase (short-subunit alcohol dehydrogenase family)